MSYYINIISKANDRYGNLLLDFLDMFSLQGLYQATDDQLKQFISMKHLDHELKEDNRCEQESV